MATPSLNSYRGGSGEPLVLIHGIGGTWREWSPVLPALESHCDVLAADLPGFGESVPQPGVRVTTSTLADAIEREIDAAGLGSAHLVGNSSGGWIALELARRGRARTVVAFSPAGMWTRLEDAYRFAMLWSAYWSAKFLAHVPALFRTPARRWALGWYIFMARPGRWSAEEAAYQIKMLGGAPSYMEYLRWTRGRRVDGLEQVGCPVLIAWGSRDLLLPKRQGPRFVRHLPAAEFRVMPGVGHMPMGDDPELIASTILEFIQRHAA
jgi:pimeloyl-ACP methyl ester carboxylesterase